MRYLKIISPSLPQVKETNNSPSALKEETYNSTSVQIEETNYTTSVQMVETYNVNSF